MALEDNEGFSEILKSNVYAVVLIGAANVGKTALVYRYVLDELPRGLTSTIGVEFTKRVVTDKQTGQKIQLHIWDTAGQERFKSVTKHYYRGADVCLLVYDMASQESFEEVPTWLNEVRENTPPECSVCLLGNKADLNKLGQRVVASEQARAFSRKHHLLYYETSAYWPRDTSFTDSVEGGIEPVFDELIRSSLQKATAKDEPPLKHPQKVKLDLSELYGYHNESRCGC